MQLRKALFSSFQSEKFSWFLGFLTIFSILALLSFFFIIPVATVMGKAFTGKDGLTFEYFFLLFNNELQMQTLFNSLLIGLSTTVLATVLTFPLALITHRLQFAGKALLSALLLVPMIMPPFVGAIGVQRLFARFGSINLFLMDNGLISAPIDWLADGNKFWAVILLEVLHLYPIMFLNLTAALANVDPSLEEMASTLTPKRWRIAKDISWPLIRPGFFAGATIVFIWALTDLGTPLLIGFHECIPVRIFHMVTDIHENPVGYAMVFLVMLIACGFFLLSKLSLKASRYQMMGRGHITSLVLPAKKTQLLYIYPFFFAVIFVAMLPHLSVLLTSVADRWFLTPLPSSYTWNHYLMVFQQELSAIGLKNSFLFSSLATLLDLVLGFGVAYIVTRKLIPMAAWLDTLVMLPLAVPGIVLAFGYVITYTNTGLDPMENPIPLLIIAYAIRRLPYMVRSASAGLQQMSVHLEEAALSFGASRFEILRKITFPLILANLIGGGLLCFSYAMLDVSDSLILAMVDQYYPLTKAIYVLYLEQGSGEYVASALGVIGMLILGSCILLASLCLGKKMGEIFKA